MMSKIVSPDSTWPPGELMNMRIGLSLSEDSATSCAVMARATLSLISPNSSTVRDLNRLASDHIRRPLIGLRHLRRRFGRIFFVEAVDEHGQNSRRVGIGFRLIVEMADIRCQVNAGKLNRQPVRYLV